MKMLSMVEQPARILRPPLIGGALVFLILLPFAVLKDVQRQKQLRYGRRLKGPEMLTPRQFNRVVKGTASLQDRWDAQNAAYPGRAEAQHMQIIGDTGAGKSALMFQMLRQVCSRGDSAIVYDPAREYVKRFYDPDRGDIILNPLDRRCPYWDRRRSCAAVGSQGPGRLTVPAAAGQERRVFHRVAAENLAFLMAMGQRRINLSSGCRTRKRSTAESRARARPPDRSTRAPAARRCSGFARLSRRQPSLLPKRSEANGAWTATEWPKSARVGSS